MGLRTGDLDVKYDNAKIKNPHSGPAGSGQTSTGPFDANNLIYFMLYVFYCVMTLILIILFFLNHIMNEYWSNL